MQIVRLNDPARADEIGAVFGRAFRDYPVMMRAFKGVADREPFIARMVGRLVRERLATGRPIWIAEKDGQIMGAALVQPSDYVRQEQLDDWWERFGAEIGTGFDAFWNRFLPAVDSIPLPVPHHFLSMIAVDPAHQGSGVGKALLTRVHEAANELGMGVALDTERPENVKLYRSQGYIVLGETQLDGMPITVMFRPA
jgi:GNAT superfamily N-acetyltransferase